MLNMWQQLILIGDATPSVGAKMCTIRYPDQYKNQDINTVLHLLGQQGFEITHVDAHDIGRIIIILKKTAIAN